MIGQEFMIAMVVTCGVTGLLFLWGIKRYHYIINPLVVFAIFDIGVLTLLSAIVSNAIDDTQGRGLTVVLYLSILYLIGFVSVFVPRQFHIPRLLFDPLLRLSGKIGHTVGYGGVSQLFLVVLALGTFVLLAQVSGAGLLWITDSRSAYLEYRAGVGYIYLLVQWMLMASFLYFLVTKNPRLFGLLMGVLLYSFAAYFTGSKNNVLAGFVVAGIYYNFFIRRLSARLIFVSIIGVLGAFMLLLRLHGSYDDFLSAISYFKDYTNTTAQFIMRFDEFGLHWGYGLVSDLWFYVPRALYVDKPYEYGITLIHEKLFPGSAALGHTPGVLPWALGYLDFGAVGVFLCGLFTGVIRRGAFESFLANRTSALSFLLMVQLSIWPIFAYATLPLTLVVGFFFAFFIRKKLVFFSSARL